MDNYDKILHIPEKTTQQTQIKQHVVSHPHQGLRYPESNRAYPSNIAGTVPQAASYRPPASMPGQGNSIAPYHIVWEPNVKDYPKNHSLVLGILQLVCGLGCILIGGISLINQPLLYFTGYGIWGGICPIVSGSFGVACVFHKNKCMIAGQIATSIVSVCIATVTLIMASIETFHTNAILSYYNQGGSANEHRGRIAVSVLLIVLSIMEGILALWVSSLACHFCCCVCCSSCCCSCYTSQPQSDDQHNTSTRGVEQVPMQSRPQMMQFTTHAYTALSVGDSAPYRQSTSSYTSLPDEERYEKIESIG